MKSRHTHNQPAIALAFYIHAMIKSFDNKTYQTGQHFRNTYLGNAVFKYVGIIDRENGKKLTKPFYTFKYLKDDRVFNCRQEDIDKSFKFKDWIPVKIDEDGNITDIL